MRYSTRNLIRAQQGFTLLELLISMSIMLVVIIAVQRFVGGVVTDRDKLSSQQDQGNQFNIILSNIQNDVARAGYLPVASVSATELNAMKQFNVGALVRPCSGNNCVGDELLVSYWTKDSTARDCLGNVVVQPARIAGWVRVENIYQFRQDTKKSPVVLGCDGNGGPSGGYWNPLTNDEQGDIESFSWQMNPKSSENTLLHVCLTTRVPARSQVAGAEQAKSCTTNTPLVNGAQAYHTTELDMLVRATKVGVTP